MHSVLQALLAELSVLGFIAMSPPDQYRSGGRNSYCRYKDVSQVALLTGFCVEEGGFGCNNTNSSLAGISASMLTVPWLSGFGSWHGCSLGTFGVRVLAVAPRLLSHQICEAGLLGEG